MRLTTIEASRSNPAECTETISEAGSHGLLDPSDWSAFRALAHRAVDDVVAYVSSIRERPVWRQTSASVRARFDGPLPVEGEGEEATWAEACETVLPHALGNGHPRFWGWVMGSGTPIGILAEMLAAAMNANAFGGDQAATWVELQVLEWAKEMVGFPAATSGVLVGGASAGNLIGLAVARNTLAEVDLARDGLGAAPRPMTLYASVETHNSVAKAVALLGLGTTALRLVPVTAAYELDVDALARAVARDRAAGALPFCVVANAGTVNTGAVDPLERIADLCAREGLWLHVDGAIGAPAALSPRLAPLLAGMERADSLTFDFHKWLCVPYGASCVLVRDAAAHRRALGASASYLATNPRGFWSGPIAFADYGTELSRSFRALKVWMSLKALGARRHAAGIERNVGQARHLVSLVADAPELELLAPAPLSIVCFRYRAPGLDDVALDRVNREIVMDLQERGVAMPSHTTIAGRTAIRVAITNHRTRNEDVELLAREVVASGRRATAGASPVRVGARR